MAQTRPAAALRPDSPDHDLSDDDSILSTQDDVQAVMQPAMSQVASHYTSVHTPAVEKAAALGKSRVSQPTGGYFDIVSDHDDDKEEPSSSPPGLPSPWVSDGRKRADSKETRTAHTRSVFGVAFGPARLRSRSAGQEALKKLKGAFPSINMSSSFLPPVLRFNDTKSAQTTPPKSPPSTTHPNNAKSSPPAPNLTHNRVNSESRDTIADSLKGPPKLGIPLRPKTLRRVTSDDSLLYHSLSRTSSLGDDGRFQDVRDMVNIRLIAIRDSLPDVPSFKMPTLPTFQELSKRSSLSLNGIFSSDPAVESPPKELHDRNAPAVETTSDDPSAMLDRVLDNLTGDIVVLGGYRGSVLRSAEPPHHQLWAPLKLGLNMRKANLEVGFEDDDEERMPETIIPSGMLKNIGPIDISRKFFKKLRSCDNAKSGKLRVWDYGYDWRLSPARLSQGLQDFLATLPSNQPGAESRGAMVVAHSLGGLITRHAVNAQPDLFAGVLFAGVPQSAVNILGPLRNGDPVLFNEKLLTAKVNLSIRTSFVLLPDTGFCFVNANTGEEYNLDFFNADDWVKGRLSPCIADTLPAYGGKPAASPPLFNNFLRSRSDSMPQRKTTDAPLPTSDAEQRRNYKYLKRTLAATKKFRSELAHKTSLEGDNKYPPLALIYGKDIPTVYAVRVQAREAIGCADAYDDLVFRSGDGVVLAKEAMLPDGYSVVRGGRVSSERGHITLLGDFAALAKALESLLRGRRKGIGMGHKC